MCAGRNGIPNDLKFDKPNPYWMPMGFFETENFSVY